jgi:hypothetical protein
MNPAEMAQAYWATNNAWKNLYKQTFGSQTTPDSIVVDAVYNRDVRGGNRAASVEYSYPAMMSDYYKYRAQQMSAQQMQQPVFAYRPYSVQRPQQTYQSPASSPAAVAKAMAKRFASKRQMRYKQCFFNPVTCFGH